MTILTLIVSNAGSDAGNDGGSILSFLLLPLMLVAMYFFIIRPNSRKRKQQQALQSALSVGDEVLTTAGIIGTITGEDGPTRFWLEIDDDVQVRIARGGISGRLEPDATNDESEVEHIDGDSSLDADDDSENADEAADQDS